MSHYKSNLRDIEFNIFEVGDLGTQLGAGPFGDFDEDSVRDVLTAVERLASGEWAESFTDGDRHPPVLADGGVELPPTLLRSLDAYYEAEWDRVSLPASLGGYGGPAQLRWAMSEMLYGANAAATFYLTGYLIAAVIDRVGTAEQSKRWALPPRRAPVGWNHGADRAGCRL